jgi:hypothetical protein
MQRNQWFCHLFEHSVVYLLVFAWMLQLVPTLSLCGPSGAKTTVAVSGIPVDRVSRESHAKSCRCRACGFHLGKLCCCSGAKKVIEQMAFRAVCDEETYHTQQKPLPAMVGRYPIKSPFVVCLLAIPLPSIMPLSRKFIGLPAVPPPRSLS